MKLKKIIIAIVFLLSTAGTSYCESGLSYEQTVASIKKTLSSETSLFRNERYGDIQFDKCNLSYSVSGTYPAGGTYTMKFDNINFCSLNSNESKVNHDYTAFLTLSFDNDISYKGVYEYKAHDETLKIRTVVINVSDDDAALTLLKGFLHLGELCGAKQFN